MSRFDNGTAHRHTIAQAFVFLLLGVFAVLSTLMVLLSAQLYRDTVARTEEHADRRILSSYVTNVVRGSDEAGMISVEQRAGLDVLAMRMEIEGSDYETLVYCYDGALRELFVEAGEEFEPDFGEIICDAQAFVPEIHDGLLEIGLVDANGCEDRVCIALRTGQEAEDE